MDMRRLELLAPAKNLGCGIAAIDHGADSVYIGGPKFGARASAGNSLEDIELLVRHAHLFGARVYVALNTLFDDRELKQAVALCHQLHDIGVDALIIQDVGLLECELPPLPLHSSTQMNNRHPAKVRFLEEVGFRQVILARELSLEAIRRIRQATSVTLEFFVHGALCVSYSGQCYMSEVVAGRSANRGECAQFCRHAFSLKDGGGKILERDRYLLSLKDLDLSSHLVNLVAAGIDSFKIEGRLKDENYVKNVTAYYRQALDNIISGDDELQRASSGSVTPGFLPDTIKSFTRGKTDYFITGHRQPSGLASILTPKSTGQPLGPVDRTGEKYFTIDTAATLANGDGLCFFDHKGRLVGIRVNRVEGKKIYPREKLSLVPGMMIYRNSDVVFNKQVAKSTGCRTIALRLELCEGDDGLVLTIIDEDDISSETFLALEKTKARKKGTASQLAAKQLRKSGGTVFAVEEVRVTLGDDLFVPAALFNELRRNGFNNHQAVRLQGYQVERAELHVNDFPWPGGDVTYLDNVVNSKAKVFYRRHGVQRIDENLQASQVESCALMTTRYCIKAQLNCCPKLGGKTGKLVEPLVLVDNTGEYRLEFDCKLCEMAVRRMLGHG